MVRIHPRRPIKYIDRKHPYVFLYHRYTKCYIKYVFEKSAESSFMLSGMPSSEKQWESIRKFSKYFL